MTVPDVIRKDSGVETVETFKDLLSLLDFVYRTVPWGASPNKSWMQKSWNDQKLGIVSVYEAFKKNQITGWCGANAQFLHLLLSHYGIKCSAYNYGLNKARFSHVGVVAQIDGMAFFLDPYFNRYYTYNGEMPLQFLDLLRLIQERKMGCIKSAYGKSKKRIFTEAGPMEEWDPMTFEKSVIGGFEVLGVRETLKELFGSDNLLLLFQIKIPA